MPNIVIADGSQPPLDGSVRSKAFAFLVKLAADDRSPGLHIEPITNSVDPRARTGRVDDFWRAVLYRLDPAGGQTTYVHEGIYPHDDAIVRAKTRRLRMNPVNGMPEFIEEAGVDNEGAVDVVAAAEVKAAEIAAANEKAAEAIARGLETTPMLVSRGYTMDGLVAELGFSQHHAAALMAAVDEVALTELVDLEFDNAWQELAVIGMLEGKPLAEIVAEISADEFVDTNVDELEVEAASVVEAEAESQVQAVVQVETATERLVDEDAALVRAFDRPAARRQFHYVDNQDELRRVIEAGDFGQWTVFLHPTQQHYVDANYKGAFRLTGGAGTGKTVVLLHRARRLARANPQARIVLTTFTRALASMLRRDLGRLDSALPLANGLGEPGIYIAGVDQLVAEVRRRWPAEVHAASERLLGASDAGRSLDTNDGHVWDEAIAAHAEELGPAVSRRSFFEEEYLDVVLRERIDDRKDYLTVARPGSGQRLGRKQRVAVWKVIEQYQLSRRIDGRLTYHEAAAVAALAVETAGLHLVDHVLIDEGQDLVPPQWQFLRAITAPGPNDLFIAEDAHQRIYGRPVRMNRVGIDLRGRSRRLKLNYRTTQETLDYALRALRGRDWESGEGDSEATTGYVSARRGPEPRVLGSQDAGEQLEALVALLHEWDEAGVDPATIAILCHARETARNLANQLSDRGVHATFVTAETVAGASSVVTMTMHQSKGQEFSRVVLYQLSADRFPRRLRAGAPEEQVAAQAQLDAALLYVAATRARDELVVSYTGEITELLK